MPTKDKVYLDRQGLAKLWELICEQFVDVTTHDLIMADYDEQIETINRILGVTGENDESIKAQIDAINELIAAHKEALDAEDARLAGVIADNKQAMDAKDAELDAEDARLAALIASNKTATDADIAALESKHDDEVEQLNTKIDTEIERLFNQIVANAPEALDTLKEIADWIAGDETGTAALIARVAALEEYKALTDKEILDICARVITTTKVGEASDLAAALATGGIVKLTADMAIAQALNVTAGQDTILNLNGHKLTTGANSVNVDGGSLTIKGGTIEGTGYTLQVTNGGTLAIDGATITSTGNQGVTAGNNSTVVFNSGRINSKEAGIAAFTGSKVVMNGGTITTTDNGGIMANGSAGKGDVDIVMNGGTINAGITSDGYVAVGIYMPNTGTFTMNGGTINAEGGAGLVARGGRSVLNGGTINATAHPTLATGKVGDSRIVVPCSAVVYDKNSKYPGMDSLEVIIGKDMRLNGAHEDVTILSDEAEPKVTDNRNA